ncbi:unnamed protein product [Rotaria sordida]|uniref:F-box domain-containing protein n=1 Tax=Rotaria sordida TaxID=392033 RepID=A0A815VZF8_9BILA|nr:unnamed protein product [Rotaria sordida]CAF1538492.1 unnamed protein product [Rotaria sordida]
MNIHNILDLPNEILEIIAFNIIDGPWKDDVNDFLSFTSTCRRFYQWSHDEKYWQKLALRRDPTNKKPTENITWLDYCKQIFLMRTISSDELQNILSRYNKNYFCTIEKILLWFDKIRIYIDERGDYSLGSIQHPTYSTIAFLDENSSDSYEHCKVTVSDSKFSIENDASQYLGYLDFVINISFDCIEKVLYFQYGYNGYSIIKLFHVEQSFIDKYNLLPLMRKCQNIG